MDDSDEFPGLLLMGKASGLGRQSAPAALGLGGASAAFRVCEGRSNSIQGQAEDPPVSDAATKPLELRVRLVMWLLGTLERCAFWVLPRGAFRRRLLRRIDGAFRSVSSKAVGARAVQGPQPQAPGNQRRVS